MPEVVYSERFKQMYAELDKETQKRVDNALRFLANDPRHNSLRSKPVQGAYGVYEARAGMKYRITYERLPGDVLRLRAVGNHDETLKNP